MYYHAAVKHGGVDITKPSNFKPYKPGYKEIELKKAIANLSSPKFSMNLNSEEQKTPIMQKITQHSLKEVHSTPRKN